MSARLLLAALFGVVGSREIKLSTLATTAKQPGVLFTDDVTKKPSEPEFTILGQRQTTVKFHHAQGDDEKEWILIQQGNWSIRIPIVVENTDEIKIPQMASRPSEWNVQRSITMDFPDDDDDDEQMRDVRHEEKRSEPKMFQDSSLWGPVADQNSIRRFWSVQHFRAKAKVREEETGTAEPPPPEKTTNTSNETSKVNIGKTTVKDTATQKPDKKLPITPGKRLRYRPSLWSRPDKSFRLSAWSMPDPFYSRIKRFVRLNRQR